jgi:RNA polymerase sigma-70 factor (ECF subfamily)
MSSDTRAGVVPQRGQSFPGYRGETRATDKAVGALLDADISTCNRCNVTHFFAMREKKLFVEETLLPHLDGAYNLARWIVESDADAQAVVQEAYTDASAQLEEFRGTGTKVRLYSLVRNRAHEWVRRKSPLSHCKGEIRLDPADKTSCARSREEQKRDLHAAVRRLPVEFREILLLGDLEGCSYAELAEVLGLSKAVVSSRLSQARLLFRREMRAISTVIH